MKVTDITVELQRTTQPDPGWNWAEAATDQWLEAARNHGVHPDVVSHEVPNVDYDTAVISDGDDYYVLTVHNDVIRAVWQEQVALYETNSHILVIAKGGQAWSLHVAGDHMRGMFGEDAKAWADGDWQPNEHDGQHRTVVTDDLRPVARWVAGHLYLLVNRDSLGGAAQEYVLGYRITPGDNDDH